MDKLKPQDAEQEHMVQILLAKMQGIEVELYDRIGKEWITSATSAVYVNTNYRIKSHELPITREMWAMIDKEWKWAAMDKDGVIYFYKDEPCIFADNDFWFPGDDSYHESILAINTDGIDWRKSLTKRPEGV